MCRTITCRFWTDRTEFVEFWGDPQNTVILPVHKAMTRPIWSDLKDCYAEWKQTPTLLIAYEPQLEIQEKYRKFVSA